LATKSRSATNQIVINLLQLRRHEKDFLLRRDDNFVAEHGKVAETVTGDIKNLASDLIPTDRMVLQQIANGLVTDNHISFLPWAAAKAVDVGPEDAVLQPRICIWFHRLCPRP
jgi:hypothetical protein